MNEHLDGLMEEINSIKSKLPYERDKGIVYVGGGKYWTGIVVGITLLRQSGCQLPIQVWYRGNCEHVFLDDVDGLDVELINIDESPLYPYTSMTDQKYGGWVAKLHAIANTTFRQILFLDADAYCILDPSPLFSLLDDKDFLYWRDLDRQFNSIKWRMVYPFGPLNIKTPPVQGGQLLIDRTRAWKLIQISNYICQNADYYFRYMYGDQDTWRLGLGLNVCKPYVIDKAIWKTPVFICKYNYQPYIIHRCQGKLFEYQDIPFGRVHYNNPNYEIPKEGQVFDILANVSNRRQKVTCENVFQNIYEKRLWGNTSEMSKFKEDIEYIRVVNKLIDENKWTTVVDVGCGNGLVGSKLKCSNYVGIDCYEDIVNKCRVKYSRTHCTYVHLDAIGEPEKIPFGDVLLCKDVLHHLPNDMVIKWLNVLLELKKWKVIILTNDRKQLYSGQDCILGGYRALSRKMEPLSMYPFELLEDYIHKSILIHYVRNN